MEAQLDGQLRLDAERGLEGRILTRGRNNLLKRSEKRGDGRSQSLDLLGLCRTQTREVRDRGVLELVDDVDGDLETGFLGAQFLSREVESVQDGTYICLVLRRNEVSGGQNSHRGISGSDRCIQQLGAVRRASTGCQH